MVEHETELKDSATFVLELIGTEKMLCSKFKEDLNLTIKEKMSITGTQCFKEVVQ